MPFTLAHPAAVLPLLRHPFVPVALIAGAMAPDGPYFLTAAGLRSTHAGDWYGSFLNATSTHSITGLPIDLLYAVLLVGAYWLLRAPITALGPTLPKIGRPTIGWLLISALIGAATHLLWDYLTEADFMPAPRLLQYASTVFGLIVVGRYLWKHRSQFQAKDDTARLSPKARRAVIATLIAVPILAAAVLAPGDYSDWTAVESSWTGIAEGVLTGAIKRAGAAFIGIVLLYAVAWQLTQKRSLRVS